MKILDILKEGSEILKSKKIPNFILESEILMSKVLKNNREKIIMNNHIQLKKVQYDEFFDLISKRASKKPIAYLTNTKSFWKNDFFVDQRVLIPRPETEFLLEEIFKITKYKKISRILDIGVGSGCLILSILKEIKKLNGVGIDIDLNALKVCRLNAKRLNLNERVKLFKSDIDKFNVGKYDVIVSNPPYISKLELRNLMKDVVDYEPKVALNGGIDGTSEIRKVIKKSSKLIRNKGKLILEISHNQKLNVGMILNKYGFHIDKIVRDYSNNYRCIVSSKI